jgi:hypothetical protein
VCATHDPAGTERHHARGDQPRPKRGQGPARPRPVGSAEQYKSPSLKCPSHRVADSNLVHRCRVNLAIVLRLSGLLRRPSERPRSCVGAWLGTHWARPASMCRRHRDCRSRRSCPRTSLGLELFRHGGEAGQVAERHGHASALRGRRWGVSRQTTSVEPAARGHQLASSTGQMSVRPPSPPTCRADPSTAQRPGALGRRPRSPIGASSSEPGSDRDRRGDVTPYTSGLPRYLRPLAYSLALSTWTSNTAIHLSQRPLAALTWL